MNRIRPPQTGQAQRRCLRCLHWEIRHQVAMRASCYIGHHIRQDFLVATVLDHVTVNWARHIEQLGHGDWGDFFDSYCLDVERDVDRRTGHTQHHAWEYHRVWTNHAAMLRKEFDQVYPRPKVWPA
jgi:hypothetical protein